MQNFLKGQKLWKYVDQQIPTPDSKDAKFEEWEASVRKINSWTANLVTPSIGNQLAKFNYPKVAWDYLARLYTQSNAAHRYKLEWEIKNPNQGNGSIYDFFIKITALWDQLSLMEPTFKTTGDAHTFEVYRQQTHLVQFLMAIRPDFEHVCGQLLHRSPLPCIDTALSELLAEEQTQFSLTRKKHVEPTHVLSANVSTPQNDRSFSSGTNDFCNYCKKTCHWKRDYPTRPQRPNNKNKHSGQQPNRGPMQSYS